MSFFVFEFKIDSSAAYALEQIKQRNYSKKYQDKQITLIGANFDSKKRIISDWLIEPADAASKPKIQIPSQRPNVQ